MKNSSIVLPALVARDVMSCDVITLSPTMRLTDAAQALARRDITGAPVCEPDGRLVGVLSHADLVHACFDEHKHVRAALVRDAMSWPVMTVRAEMPLTKVVRLMLFESIHRIIVVGESGEVVGVVTPLDVLRGTAPAAP